MYPSILPIALKPAGFFHPGFFAQSEHCWYTSPQPNRGIHEAADDFPQSTYAFTTTFFIIAWDGTHHRLDLARHSFSYFTNLTYWGLAFYFFFSALHTFSYVRTGSPLLFRWPRPLQALHSFFYTTVVTFPILVTVVFWAILYSGPWFPVTFKAWSNTSQHVLNCAFALFEIMFPRSSPPPFLHLLFLILILALYLALAYITNATEGFYPYGFLDPSNGHSGRVAAYASAILAAVIVIFLVVWALIWARRQLTEGTMRMKGTFYGRRERVGEDVEMPRYLGK